MGELSNYVIFDGDNVFDVMHMVNGIIRDGYIPLGGCAYQKGWLGSSHFAQAVIKVDEPKKEWKIVRRVCSALVPEVGIKEFEEELTRLSKEGWKPDGDTLSMPVKTGQDPTFILLKPMYRKKE